MTHVLAIVILSKLGELLVNQHISDRLLSGWQWSSRLLAAARLMTVECMASLTLGA